MKITHTSSSAVKKALDMVEEKFDNNIRFEMEPTNKKCTTFRVVFKVHDPKGAGAGLRSNRRKDGGRGATGSACWHVHGYFHDCLNEEAVIYTMFDKKSPGDAWVDWVKGREGDFPGSLITASELCHCDDDDFEYEYNSTELERASAF